ncbi:MAG: tail fiber domain-containing protein [Symploca sp. SIO2E9]|nr:tail fiber domain-containing protein [Symploca sp. SIO2E9]
MTVAPTLEGTNHGAQIQPTLTSTGNDQVLTALKIAPNFQGSNENVKKWGLFVEQGNVAINSGTLAIGSDDPAEHKLKVTGGSTLLEGIVTVAPTLEGTNHGAQIQPTLTSTGNDQVLTALKIAPNFQGSNENVKKWGLFVEQGNVAIASGTLAIGSDDPAEHKLKVTGGETYLEGALTVQHSGATSPALVVTKSDSDDDAVGIGKMPDSTDGVKLDVNGKIRTTDKVLTNSDLTLKENIQTLKDGLSKILGLRGVSYKWKNDKKAAQETQIGLVAQEVEKIFPELVSTDSQGIKSLSYSKLIAPLIEAVKEQQNQISELVNQVQQQQTQIEQLQASGNK